MAASESQARFVKEKILGDARIQQVNATRFEQVQQLGYGNSWEEFSLWAEELWRQWARHKSKVRDR